jgi:hypothetical protein
MPIWRTKITHSTFTLSPFTPEQMQQIGQAMLDQKLDRISRVINSQDQPAKPLVPHYARRKSIRGRAPVRDWLFSGALRSSLKVKSANNNQVVIGNTRADVDARMGALRAIEEMWSDSLSDLQVLHDTVTKLLQNGAGELIRTRIAESEVA